VLVSISTYVGSMGDADKFRKILAQWPIGLVALGVALTLIWIALFAWYPLRLLLLASLPF